MKPRSEILEKIEKLLSRAAAGRGNSEAEMESAMKMAQKLAIEHSIDLATVAEGEVKAPGIAVTNARVHTSTKYERPYHQEILTVLRDCFAVRTVLHSYWTGQAQRVITGITIIGETADVQIATYCWTFLEQVFPRCWSEYKKASGTKEGWVASRSYWVGLARGIRENNRRAVAELAKDARDKYALVLVDKNALVTAEMSKMFPKLGTVRQHQKDVDFHAMSSGIEKGRSIKLGHGIQ